MIDSPTIGHFSLNHRWHVQPTCWTSWGELRDWLAHFSRVDQAVWAYQLQIYISLYRFKVLESCRKFILILSILLLNIAFLLQGSITAGHRLYHVPFLPVRITLGLMLDLCHEKGGPSNKSRCVMHDSCLHLDYTGPKNDHPQHQKNSGSLW